MSNLLNIFTILLVPVSIAAWITHIVVTIKTASWGLLVAGTLIAPIGVVHGIGCWLGVF